MLMIGDFSKLSRISIQMLRHYDRIGLLTPVSVDPYTGYRYYQESQLPAANRIRAMKEMGLGLHAIRAFLEQSDEQVISGLKQHQDKLLKDINILNSQLLLTKNRIETMENQSESSHYHVSYKEVPEMEVMCCRGLLKQYQEEGKLWATLFKEMARQKVKATSPMVQMAVFHNESYMEEDIDVEVQCAVTGNYSDHGDVFFSRRKPVPVAAAVYQGDYDRLADINEAIAGWIFANNYRICGPGFNIYHISPGDTKSPEQMVTEVCFPVESVPETGTDNER